MTPTLRRLPLLLGIGAALTISVPARAVSFTLTGTGETVSVISTMPRAGSDRVALEPCVPCGIRKVEAVTRYGQWILGEEALTTIALAVIEGSGDTVSRPLSAFVASRLAAYGIPASDSLVILLSNRVRRYVAIERFMRRGVIRFGAGGPGAALVVLRPSSLSEVEWREATRLARDENGDRAATADEIRRLLTPRPE